jgi:YVTN family beta-propeller protein
VVILTGIFFALDRWGVHHATYMSGGYYHPSNCITCHVYPQRTGLLSKMVNRDYLSPLNLTLSPDGRILYVTTEEGNSLLEVDLAEKRVNRELKTGIHPHTLVLTKDGTTGYLSNSWSNSIFVIDMKKLSVRDTLLTGGGPSGISLSPDEKNLYVSNTYTSDISIFNLENGTEIRRLTAGKQPRAIQFTPDGTHVYVTSRRSVPVPWRAQPKTELTVIDPRAQRVTERKYFVNSHVMENMAITPSGDLGILTLIRPKNLVPAAQIEGGWMINHGFGVMTEEGTLAQFLLDEPNQYYADPYDVVISPDGKRAYISSGGANVVNVIDLDKIRSLLENASEEQLVEYSNHLGLSSQFVIKRIPTDYNPRGLVLTPDGKTLFVAERLADRIGVIDTKKMEKTGSIDLGGPDKITFIRKGERLFFNSGYTFQGQYSCSSCHPDGHEDGLTYDMAAGGMGRNMTNSQTLRDLGLTSPYKWNGKNVSIYMQCGMRFSKFVTRTEVFPPEKLDQLVGFIIRNLSNPPNPYVGPDGELTPPQKRGKEIFERTVDNYGKVIPEMQRCVTCHPDPLFTDKKKSDVGSLSPSDDPMLLDTPELTNIYESAPYLHDGKAATLEEIWTVYGSEDAHGRVNDFTKMQLNDLIEYLKSIGYGIDYKKTNIKKGSL